MHFVLTFSLRVLLVLPCTSGTIISSRDDESFYLILS